MHATHSRLKSTHEVAMYYTHIELITDIVDIYVHHKVYNILTHGYIDHGYSLPILHLLPVHPGSQIQLPDLSQTPFSQGGSQTAEERVKQMAT